jgi:hypothetical protein
MRLPLTVPPVIVVLQVVVSAWAAGNAASMIPNVNIVVAKGFMGLPLVVSAGHRRVLILARSGRPAQALIS